MAELTDRQLQILKAIIEEFTANGEPVGSEELTQKRQFDFSPATVRNEMAVLHREGFIEKPHASGGRKPTDLSLRYYLTSLMQEQPLPVLQEVAIKQRLFQHRQSSGKMLREAALALAEGTGYIGIITTHEEVIYQAGSRNALEYPEFYDINITRATLNLLDSFDLLNDLFSRASDPKATTVLIGKELGLANLESVGLVFTHWGSAQKDGSPEAHLAKGGVVAVLGPNRLNYPTVVPQVRYFAQLLTELSASS